MNIAQDFPAGTEVASNLFELWILAGDVQEAADAFERCGWAVIVLLRQECGQQGAACRTADADAFRHEPQRLDQAGSLRRGAAKREHQLVGIQVEKFSDTQRRAEHTAGGGDMPAARIMIRRDSVTDAACKLDPECQGCLLYTSPSPRDRG